MGQLASRERQKVRSIFFKTNLNCTEHFDLSEPGFFFFFLFLSFFLRLCSEVPLLEDTLMRILVIGLSRDLPLGPADAMELADHLVKRAAGVHSDGV